MNLNIAVLGTGRVGSVLGRRWAEKGYRVVFGSRQPESERVVRLTDGWADRIRVLSNPAAAAEADVVVYAVPWSGSQALIESLGPLTGKILVDCTNPLNATFSGLDLGYTTSAAEQIAAWAKGARVVKAFNNISAAIMANPVFGSDRATMFYCGDDKEAKATVRDLAAALDLDPVDAGPLTIARYLEPFAMLYIQLAVKEGWGSHCAFRIMRR
ncbi:MAG: NADPH-dependent F420 reductase [Pirellulaceae bacterium]